MALNTGKSNKLVKDRFNLGNMQVTADHIKAMVLHYFRYTRANVFMCCTELTDPFTGRIEDIVCREERHGKTLYHAIEVKISESDFKREFWHKKDKHKERGDGRFYDFFYFAVPQEMIAFVDDYMEQEMLPYGLFGIYFDDSGELDIKLVKSATQLKPQGDEDNELDDESNNSLRIDKVDSALCARMSSEVAKLNADVYKLKDGLAEVKRQLDYLAKGIKLS